MANKFKPPMYPSGGFTVNPEEFALLQQMNSPMSMASLTPPPLPQQEIAPTPPIPSPQDELPVDDDGVAEGSTVEAPGEEPLAMPSGPTEKNLNEELIRRSQEALEQQRQGVLQNEDYINKFRQDSQLDLSPLMALTDTWTGSNLSKSYKAPLSAEEKQKELIMLQDALQKQRNALSDKEIDLIKSQIIGKKQDRSDRIAGDKIRKEFTDATKDVQTTGAMYSRLEETFKSGDLAAIKGALVQYVRAVGGEKGPLSDNDVARSYVNSLEDVVGQLQLKFGANAKIPLDHPSLVNLIQATAQARQYAQEGYAGKINAMRDYLLLSPGYESHVDSIEKMADAARKSLYSSYAKKSVLPKVKKEYGEYVKKSAIKPKKSSGGLSDKEKAEKEALEKELGM